MRISSCEDAHLGLTGENVVSVSPDAGRAKMAGKFAEMLEADLAIMNKTRPSRDSAAVTEVIGRVQDKVAIKSILTSQNTEVNRKRFLQEARAAAKA